MPGDSALPEFSSLMQGLIQIMEEAACLFQESWDKPRHIQHKGVVDLVTETDLAIEAFLKQQLKALLPSANILAEESAEQTTPQGLCWVIDPVDGTTNFAHGIPLCCISVALWDNDHVELGVVAVPMWQQFFMAQRGKGAWLNTSQIQVSQVALCAEALVETGFPYNVRDIMDQVLQETRILLAHCVGVRRMGAAALDLCWVASGKLDGYFERGLKPWDAAAGWLILEEAGGRMSSLEQEHYTFHQPVLATNGRIHEELRGYLLEESGKNPA